MYSMNIHTTTKNFIDNSIILLFLSLVGLKCHNLSNSELKNHPERCITSAFKDQIGSEQNFIRISSELM